MNTDVTWQTDCSSLAESLALAENLGQKLQGQEVIELVSDLGGGKTTFVKGIARGIGSADQVTSPTFTLSNVYQGPKLSLRHYDFYRLGEAGIMGDELTETLEDPKAVTVVEWAGIVNSVLPADRLTITITATGEESRHYEFEAHGTAQTLLQEIRDANSNH